MRVLSAEDFASAATRTFSLKQYHRYPSNHLAVVEKYSATDLIFVTRKPRLTDRDVLSLEELQELGFLEYSADQKFFDSYTSEFLAKSVSDKYEFLLLFLETESPLRAQLQAESPTPSFPVDYFPREFTVVDACLTNARFIWMERHFYL